MRQKKEFRLVRDSNCLPLQSYKAGTCVEQVLQEVERVHFGCLMRVDILETTL